MNRYAIILAAGKGTRMKSELPKVLHQVAGKSMLWHVGTSVRKAKVGRVITVVGHGADQVIKSLPDGAEYVKQEAQLGTGHAVMIAKDLLKDSQGQTLVIAGDMALITADTIAALFDYHTKEGAKATILTSQVANPTGYGRIIREDGRVTKIVEEKDATAEEKAVQEVNTATYVFDNQALFEAVSHLTTDNAQGEYYLTDVIEILNRQQDKVAAFVLADNQESLGVNNQVELAQAQAIMRERINQAHMVNGVVMVDPASTYIDAGIEIGSETVIEPNVVVKGATSIGKRVVITSGSRIEDSVIHANVEIRNSTVESSVLHVGSNIGPYAHLRPETILHENVHIGNFVEVKGSSLGCGTKAGHLTYIGNATIGEGVNFGAGTITVNYDGKDKYPTEIEDFAFIGSNSTLIAPLTIGKNAITTAGSTITHDVPEEAMSFGRAKQVDKLGRAKGMPHYKGN